MCIAPGIENCKYEAVILELRYLTQLRLNHARSAIPKIFPCSKYIVGFVVFRGNNRIYDGPTQSCLTRAVAETECPDEIPQYENSRVLVD